MTDLKRGYPTPNAPTTITMTTRCVPIPDIPEFIALIGGLLFQATKEYFWQADGDMSPEQCAELMKDALGLYDALEACTLSCEQIIDCIENDPATMQALLDYLAGEGFAPSGNGGSPEFISITPTQSAGNLLPAGYNCADGQAMATARQIIREFNEAAEDFFDSVELITNTAELGVITTDGIPVVDTINNVADLVDWLVQTMREQYQASYSQEVEDILACAVYCAIIGDCELTYDELISIFANYADPNVAFPDTSSFQNIADWALTLTLTLGVGTVATFFWILVQAMRFGSGTIFQIAGLTSLKSLIAMSIGWNDTSYTECDECPPTETPNNYWYMDFQFQLGEQGWYLTNTSASFINGGFESDKPLVGTYAQIDRNIDTTTLYLAGVRETSLRRGSIGNGTYDFKQLRTFALPDGGGATGVAWTDNFLTCNTNECINAKLDFADNVIPFQSLRIAEGVDGNWVPAENLCRITRVELWGWNHADHKPVGSVWVDAIV